MYYNDEDDKNIDEYNPNLFGSKISKIKDKDQDESLFKWIMISAGVSMVILFILITVASDVVKNLANIIAGLTHGTNYSVNLPFATSRKNILLIGTDSNGRNTDPFEGVRSDTLVVVNIDPGSKNVNLVSIPRDSKVYIGDGHGVDKINAAFAFGGPELTIQTIETTLGIKIDYYIVFNYNSVKKIVEAIGGVPVYVEKNMHYSDHTGQLFVNLQKGEQVLNADQAEQYLRFRKDALGDIGRMRRQQWFLKGIAQKFQSPEIITKIPELIKVLNETTKTNMSVYQMSGVAAYARTINLDQVQLATLPGGPSSKGHISYWLLNPEETQNIIDRMIYRINEAPRRADGEKYTVGVIYQPSKREKAQTVISSLEQMGYEVKCTGLTKNPHSQIYGHSDSVTFDEINKLKKIITPLSKAQFIIAPEDYQCGKTDITIFVSES